MSTKALWSMVKSGFQALIKSEAAEKVVAFVVSAFFKVPLSKTEEVVDSVKGWVLAAGEKYPQSGTGAQKWAWVWGRCKATLGDFIEEYGAQTMELIIMFVLRALTAQGKKT